MKETLKEQGSFVSFRPYNMGHTALQMQVALYDALISFFSAKENAIDRK